MEVKQEVDLERVYQMFLDKAYINPNTKIISKSLQISGNHVFVNVRTKTLHGGIGLYQSIYSIGGDEIRNVDSVFIGEHELDELKKLLET